MNDNELNNMMNITDDVVLSDEMIQAYMDASALETPDLWSRVENGFDQEIQMLQQERTTHITNAPVYMPDNIQQSGLSNVQQLTQQYVPQGMVPNGTDNKVIDISKRVARKKTFAAIAAIVVLCIIAVPVMKMVGNNNSKSEEGKSTAAAVDYAAEDTEASYKGADDLADMPAAEAPAVDASGAESQDEAETEVDNQQTVNAVTDVDEADIVPIKVNGYFVYDGDDLIFMIETVLSDPTGKLYAGGIIELHDSDSAAETYFEKADYETAYGPFDVQINVDADSIDGYQITGVLLAK